MIIQTTQTSIACITLQAEPGCSIGKCIDEAALVSIHYRTDVHLKHNADTYIFTYPGLVGTLQQEGKGTKAVTGGAEDAGHAIA